MAEIAAGYLFAIAKNHAFVDGNKGTVWTVMRLFIGLKSGKIEYDKFDAMKFVEGVAGSNIDVSGVRAPPLLPLFLRCRAC